MNDVRQIVERINDSWRTGNLDQISEHFHPDIVIVGPGFEEMARGREKCIASYREFLRTSVVQQHRESKFVVREWESAAVVTYEWEMHYEQGDELHRETGSDLFVFQKHQGRWLAIWRAVTFAVAPSDP